MRRLRAAGFGVAMGSAPPELRGVAHAVVGDVAHDGVAERSNATSWVRRRDRAAPEAPGARAAAPVLASA